MNKTARYGVSTAFVMLLCGLFVGLPASALATKSCSKKSDARPASRLTAAGAPKESRQAFSRISARRIHGVNSLRQSTAPRSVRRDLARLRTSRAAPAQQGQALDSSRIQVIDGDTFAYGAERVRIQGFNAAERSDPGGVDGDTAPRPTPPSRACHDDPESDRHLWQDRGPNIRGPL